MESRPRRVWRWLVANWEVAIALVLAGVFGLLGALDAASEHLLRGATLGVLALVAISLVRLRSDRDKTHSLVEQTQSRANDIEQAVAGLRLDVSAIEAGTPWRVV